MKKNKFKNITFRSFFEERAELAQYMYDGIITPGGQYQVDNIRVYDLKGREFLVHENEWKNVDAIVLQHWLENSPDFANQEI